MRFKAAVITAILALTAVSGVSAALADGDPASDVLATYPLFNPPDASVPSATAARLEAVLKASAKAGFPIRVALINSATDLGTVTQFWGDKPSRRAGEYAKYLGTELSELFNGQVLVVMPGGYGLYAPNSGPHALRGEEQSASIPIPTTGPQLADVAMIAVSALAKADGHPIARAEIHVQPIATSSSGSSWTEWVALAAGLLVIAGCWRWSLRVRPLRRRGLARP